jgi:aspartate/methionine/tyrosine aminotransferase
VYSREHLEAVLAFASSRRLLVISDEIYSEMAFGGARTYPLSSLTRDVPLLVVGGVSKRYLVPGWRLGWLIAVDRGGVLARSGVLPAIRSLSQVCETMHYLYIIVFASGVGWCQHDYAVCTAETVARNTKCATICEL